MAHTEHAARLSQQRDRATAALAQAMAAEHTRQSLLDDSLKLQQQLHQVETACLWMQDMQETLSARMVNIL